MLCNIVSPLLKYKCTSALSRALQQLHHARKNRTRDYTYFSSKHYYITEKNACNPLILLGFFCNYCFCTLHHISLHYPKILTILRKATMAEQSKELSTEQQAAIDAFAAKYGASWKHKLQIAWLAGTDTAQPNGHLLRQVRNQFGPSWLSKYKESK